MKRFFLCTVSLMVALCTALSAQSINGTWQGRLPIPDNPRIAIKIADDGSLRGTLYLVDKLIDKGPLAAALTSVTFTAPDLSVEQVNLDLSYRGKRSSDGKSIDGNWSQNNHSYPLTLVLATSETIWKSDGPVTLPPMSPNANPAFEVATIKPSSPDEKGSRYGLRTRQFVANNKTVEQLVEFAYQVHDHRWISGGPSWIDESKFDIAGEPDTEGLPSIDQYWLMLKKLLASRFQLRTHVVQQTFPVYALSRDEKAPKLPHSDPEFDTGNIYVKDLVGGQTAAHFVGLSMPMFADMLMNFIEDRQIVDETGLTGHFEFTMRAPTSDLHGDPLSGPADDRADVFRRALQPLGFKLVPKKEPLDVVVIDHLEKPSAN
jgi:uncharacterized protein (TIGR03435 family)